MNKKKVQSMVSLRVYYLSLSNVVIDFSRQIMIRQSLLIQDFYGGLRTGEVYAFGRVWICLIAVS